MSDFKICRICLNTEVRGFKMDEHHLRDYYEFTMRKRINPKDNLPHWFCYECATMLHKFHKFKEKCKRGEFLLKQIAWRGDITYESVQVINRYHENLVSPISVVMRNKRIKTTLSKHKSYVKPKHMELEKVLLNLDNEDSMKPEDNMTLAETKSMNKTDEKTPNEVVDKVEIKFEPTPLRPSQTIKYEDQDEVVEEQNMINNAILTSNDVAPNEKKLDVEIDNDDHMDNDVDNASSDDENLLLEIVKKAVNGENKLVFLDNIEIDTKPKKNKKKSLDKPRGKVQKFARPKKQYFNPEHWRKFSLNEEDAMHEFKQREHSDKYVNANYKCHNCLKGFSKIEMLMRHVKLRHDESLGPIECRFCHMRFRQKNQLGKHVKQHYSVYHCLRCDMRFRLESSAIFHEDYHNGVIRKCKYCGEEFKHSSTYYTHVRMLHRSSHVCAVCGVSFVSEVGLQQHRRIKHFDLTATETPAAQSSDSSTYCEKCDVKFVSQEAYNEHLTHSNMHDDPDNAVTRKNIKGNRRLSLNFKESRKKKPTTCQYCGKHFATQAGCMKHHLAEHPRRAFYPPDQRHICEVCGVSLAAVSIASHMNRHTREHVYPCAICGMQFISKSSHHRHQVTHTGERPYPCPLCEKRFTQKNSMQLHYRTFHLKQPYPKRNRRKKTDEMPIMESCRERSDIDSLDSAPLARWRPAL